MNGRHLCIGGPKAGERVETRNGWPRFIASETVKQDALGFPGDGPSYPAEFRRVTYHQQVWSNADGTAVTIWAPEGQSPAETMAALLKAYEERTRG